ncbi:unnamed protein product [Miscanthus lutarioriparius]|uniref:HAT C-terminal dimerisation domain-containing protein n=1 Tax=Miscanthus lutarioriparius TaxID=422564 RepID=A0A811QBZ7_9POAL|nr:unnamed protein product [Miscanthus lutarioriparius]
MAPTEDGVSAPTKGKAKAKTKTVRQLLAPPTARAPAPAPAATTSPAPPPAPAPVNIGEDDQDDEEQAHLSGKRYKKCTSHVWKYFTKKKEVIEVDGKQYEQLWGYCNFARCNKRYRAEGPCGTTAFKSHLRSKHSIVEGQQQLNVGKNTGSEIAHIVPFKYDQEVSLRKLNLAITMHEYPFNIVEHEYLVDFIESLRPSFPIKSRVTVRKEIIDRYLEEKETLYAHLKTIKCRFSATMDMWTSCQNKEYMCVTIHWIDDNWRIQKRIIGFFNVKGRHTGAKLSETFSEVMVKWYIEKRLFALTLDNASSNEVAVNDIISDLKENGNGSLVCDGLFFHVRCACHILNLVARDGLKVISETISKVKSLVLAVKGSPLQWEELMKCATEAGLDTKRGIQIDVSTRWNSTYLMLRDALYYKDAFIRLKSSNRRRYAKISPSSVEWEKALTIYGCLKKFYDLTEILSGTSYPTANLFYRAWWKNKREEYPILSQIVRDVMAVQVSTVASESAFSAAGRVVDPYRSRLDPEMVHALICTKDWVAAANAKVVGLIVSDLEVDALTNVVAKLKIEDKDKEGNGDSRRTMRMQKTWRAMGTLIPDIMDDLMSS